MRVLDREHDWPLEPDGTLTLRILFDVNCIEVFGPCGMKVMSSIYSKKTLEQLDEKQPALSFCVQGGTANVKRMVVHQMSSIWSSKK